MTRRGLGTLRLRNGSVWTDREADARYAEGERMDRDAPVPCAGPVNPESEEARRGRREADATRERLETEHGLRKRESAKGGV